jgi:hypothetical protein
MEIKTFNTILTELCDDFDVLITPRTMARSNTNIIYLIFKAIAKGMEVINNVCVTLSSKFNPENCSDEDLLSVASLVGTERRKGSASGLRITVTNKGEDEITLLAGTYTYELDEETSFEFEVLEDISDFLNSELIFFFLTFLCHILAGYFNGTAFRREYTCNHIEKC